ncbi:hypothetical protein NLJ89_g6897 [Agrocybe chaxingu]|uniref:FAD/NAD(P)-binding domain-containing protein n=1 Tax=Agrocybe chaxingu TaxID=84603 RepID=A0A9W8JYD6_9AGAR|nr:hypothetical protein NLJ89_g6897 [Agrocybe chaxingu]
MSSKNIVIVGGGTAGLNVFNGLAAKLATSTTTSIILVTPRPHYTSLPATIRMVVTAEGELEKHALMSFPESFNQGNKKVVLAKAVSIEDDETKGRFVTLDNGEKIEFSVLVLAPGSKWEGPLDFPESVDGQLQWTKDWREKFAKAKSVALVGGGAIGIELSGELKDQWPNKPVTIVQGDALLLNKTYPDRFRKDIERRVVKRGVKVIKDDFVDDVEPKEGKIVTRKGVSVEADLVIPTRGPRPNTKFIESLGSENLTDSGFVKVKPTLQLVNHPRIFAAGDVIDYAEQKQAAKAPNHAAVIVNNTLSLIGENPKGLINYKGSTELIVITNGKNGGAGYFDILWGISIGDWLSSLLKSKTLMIEMSKNSLKL